MAKANQKKGAAPTGVAVKQSTAVGQSLDFSQDAGAGMEGATAESFAIPFLAVIQKMSPQVDEANPAQYIEGAKPGMLLDTVSRKFFDGKTGLIIVPCAYRRVFIRWGGRDSRNPGFKGELSADEIAVMRAEKKIVEVDGRLYAPEKDGSVNPETSDRFSDTRNHYVLIVDQQTGETTQALMSLTSTQIKKSKSLMSMLGNVRFKSDRGDYQPPTYGCQIKITTVPESNDKGNWHGVAFEFAGPVDRSEVYEKAKAFNNSVKRGAVQPADYNAVSPGGESTGTDREGF